MYAEMPSNFDEAFFSFQPWWSMHENRTIIMLADSPYQVVKFYVAMDDYPLIYDTYWLDKNEMFALQPWNPNYSDGNGMFGSYYIRVRPQYTLAGPSLR